MKRFSYITIFIFMLIAGIVSTHIIEIIATQVKQISANQNQVKRVYKGIAPEVPPELLPENKYKRFWLLQRDFNGFQFQSSNEERRFKNGANISILHNFVSPEGMREIFDANCTKKRKGQSIKRTFKPDESEGKILHKCVIVERNGDTRIIWNESKTEYWTIDATSLSLAEEFEGSETFRSLKSK